MKTLFQKFKNNIENYILKTAGDRCLLVNIKKSHSKVLVDIDEEREGELRYVISRYTLLSIGTGSFANP